MEIYPYPPPSLTPPPMNIRYSIPLPSQVLPPPPYSCRNRAPDCVWMPRSLFLKSVCTTPSPFENSWNHPCLTNRRYCTSFPSSPIDSSGKLLLLLLRYAVCVWPYEVTKVTQGHFATITTCLYFQGSPLAQVSFHYFVIIWWHTLVNFNIQKQ